MNYLITYSFKTDLNENGNGNSVIIHKKYFKDIKELDDTRKIIAEKLKDKIKGIPIIVIENIIKFPIK